MQAKQREPACRRRSFDREPSHDRTAAPRPPRPGVIMEIAGLCAGQERCAAGVAKVHKLSSNENPLGASPAAIEAVREAAAKLDLYPDGSATRLREAIAEVHGLNPANIVCSQRLRRTARPARPDLSDAGR